MAIKPLNSVAGFSVGETPANVILANGDITTTNITTTGVSNLNAIGNVRITGGSAGQVIQTDGSGILSFVTIDSAALNNGTSNIRVYQNGNIALSVGGNANIAIFTDTGANINGYLSVTGNANVGNLGTGLITATGNITGANVLTTGLVSAGGNVTGGNIVTSGTVSASGNIQGANLTTTGEVSATGSIFGANISASGNIAATGNLVSNNITANGTLSAGGNANVANLGTGGLITATGNITGANFNTAGQISAGGNATVGGILTDNYYYANGAPVDFEQPAGSNTQIQFNDNGDFGASANFTFNNTTNQLYVNGTLSTVGNANIGNIGTGIITATGNITGGNLSVSGNVNGSNIIATDAVIGNIQLSGNIIVNSLTSNTTISATGNIIGGNLNTAGVLSVTGNANVGNLGTTGVYASTLSASGNAAVGGILTDNYYYANGAPVDFEQPAGSNTQIQFNDNGDFGASSNLTYNTATGVLEVAGNAEVGAILTDNYYYANGSPVDFQQAAGANYEIQYNINDDFAASANFTYNDTTQQFTVSGNAQFNNANLGNLATANYVNVANDINVIGNITGANLVGSLANGNSNVKVYGNANVEVTVGGNANVATFATTGLYVVGEINTTAGNMLSNGNVTANGFLNGANANVSGEALLGSVTTATITAPTGNIIISAAGTDQSINLVPTGNGVVDVSGKRIADLADPVDPTDAATKEYVDSMAGEGLDIHTPVRVESPDSAGSLNATYAQGGTTPTVDSITGGKTIDFGAAHGLSVNDGIVFDNSFNGLVGGEAYWVFSVPSSTSITVKDGYYSTEVTTLSNGTSLGESSRANPGVGATLTSNVNEVLTIDGIALSATNRVLIYNQTDPAENGIYVVTDAGSISTPWILTRATDFNKYNPDSPNGISKGSYVFVTSGSTGAGESYVMTAPIGELIVGTDGLTFTQFSAAGSYTAGSGINITGTTISANVDNVTTAIVGGNIVVKTSAQFTTPNIDAATGTSLSVTGNVTANNISVGNVANVGLDLTVGGLIQANGNISSNSWVNANNIFSSGNISAQGNVLVGNLTANAAIAAANVNVSGTTVTNVLTVNNAITGNTANFSGAVTVNGLTVNLQVDGNTASFTGNANVGNLGTGGLITATGNITGGNIVTGGLITATGNLTAGNISTGGTLTSTGTITGGNIATAGYANVGTNLNIGNGTVNTTITWASVETTSVSANQTIASFSSTGVTGVEYIVKAVDAAGSKYSVATVQAVTDGSSVDYATFATVQLGGYTGSLAVNISGGFVRLQVTPASSNSTIWTTQYRLI